MSKTPEQRAARIAPIGTIKNEVVAKLIRAAENAALERAARAFMPDLRTQVGDLVRDRIRSLKTKAPSRRKS